MQLFALGLLGELIIFTHAREIKDYQIDTVTRYPQGVPAEGAPPAAVAHASADAHTHVV